MDGSSTRTYFRSEAAALPSATPDESLILQQNTTAANESFLFPDSISPEREPFARVHGETPLPPTGCRIAANRLHLLLPSPDRCLHSPVPAVADLPYPSSPSARSLVNALFLSRAAIPTKQRRWPPAHFFLFGVIAAAVALLSLSCTCLVVYW